MLAGARARRHNGAADARAAVDFDLDGRLPAAVENLAGVNGGNLIGHMTLPH
jgi:hypothetical protein